MPAVVFFLIETASWLSTPAEILKPFFNAWNYLTHYPAVVGYAFFMNSFLIFWMILGGSILRRKRWAFIAFLSITVLFFGNLVLDALAEKYLLHRANNLLPGLLISAAVVIGPAWKLLEDQMDE